MAWKITIGFTYYFHIQETKFFICYIIPRVNVINMLNTLI